MSKREAKELAEQWTPVRKGTLYCSPGCGRGCSWAEHQEAKKKAEALAQRLGPGWRPVVHENLGWHYSATKGKAEVHPVGFSADRPSSTYWISVNGSAKQFTARGRDPVALVRTVVSQMRETAAAILSEASEVQS